MSGSNALLVGWWLHLQLLVALNRFFVAWARPVTNPNPGKKNRRTCAWVFFVNPILLALFCLWITIAINAILLLFLPLLLPLLLITTAINPILLINYHGYEYHCYHIFVAMRWLFTPQPLPSNSSGGWRNERAALHPKVREVGGKLQLLGWCHATLWVKNDMIFLR